jgi:hypothetical protein
LRLGHRVLSAVRPFGRRLIACHRLARRASAPGALI